MTFTDPILRSHIHVLPSRVLPWLAAAALAGGCDLGPKNVGDEHGDTGGTGGTHDDGHTGSCEPGETKPADDGCNTCSCTESGEWACTERACDPDGMCPDNPDFDCAPLDCTDGTSVAGDCGPLEPVDEHGCLRLSCSSDEDCASGQACYTPADYDGCHSSTISCEPGDAGSCQCIATDDCGGSYCVDEDDLPGSSPGWPGTSVSVCPEDIARAPLNITAASVSGDDLLVSVSHSGGCAMHLYAACWDGQFLDTSDTSDPPQVDLFIAHEDNGDTCEAIENSDETFDLQPLAEAYGATNGTSDTIEIVLEGHDAVLTYTF